MRAVSPIDNPNRVDCLAIGRPLLLSWPRHGCGPDVDLRLVVRTLLESPTQRRPLILVLVIPALIHTIRFANDTDIDNDHVCASSRAVRRWLDHVVHDEVTLYRCP